MKTLGFLLLGIFILSSCGNQSSDDLDVPETANSNLPEAPDTKYYVGDTETCQIIRYTCKENWSYFGDEIGCGCEKK